jgi:hypothetical protein
MKRLFMIFVCCFPLFTFAQTMCVRDRSLVISLDSSMRSTGGGANAAESIWFADYPYGRIFGESTCLSESEGLGQTSMGGIYGTGAHANTLINAEPGLSGVDADGNERKYCWCRITHPVKSAWVLNGADCTYCFAHSCPNSLRLSYPDFHKGIFGSVGL